MVKKVYLISPVRDAKLHTIHGMNSYVNFLEAQGCEVHYPLRDVIQTQSARDICDVHCMAMSDCCEVHVWLVDGDLTEGSKFDLGMAFMLHSDTLSGIKFVIANGPIERTEHKSLLNVLLDLVEGTKNV
ncbi:MAG: hypothetical protein KAR40_06275 [Candidatus Sabulitectum sp.]|nr:hypothetical protein [Candidatus Sabulitectum sp.]